MIFLFFKPYVALLEAKLARSRKQNKTKTKIEKKLATFELYLLKKIFFSFGAERRPLQILIGMIER